MDRHLLAATTSTEQEPTNPWTLWVLVIAIAVSAVVVLVGARNRHSTARERVGRLRFALFALAVAGAFAGPAVDLTVANLTGRRSPVLSSAFLWSGVLLGVLGVAVHRSVRFLARDATAADAAVDRSVVVLAAANLSDAVRAAPQDIRGALARRLSDTAGSLRTWWSSLVDTAATPAIAQAAERSSHARGRALGSLLGWGLLLLFVLILVAAMVHDDSVATVIGQYFSLVGLSVLLASTPGFVLTWVLLVLVSGQPRVGAALQNAGDLAGRGLAGGLIVGIALFTLHQLGQRAGGAFPLLPDSSDWLGLLLGLSVAGSVVGFALSQVELLDGACRSQKLPRVAWLTTPALLAVVLGGTSTLILDPRDVFRTLVESLTRGLPAVSGVVTEADVSRDWRYAFVGDSNSLVNGLPGPMTVTICWTVLVALVLWFRWARSSRAIAEGGDVLSSRPAPRP